MIIAPAKTFTGGLNCQSVGIHSIPIVPPAGTVLEQVPNFPSCLCPRRFTTSGSIPRSISNFFQSPSDGTRHPSGHSDLGFRIAAWLYNTPYSSYELKG